MGNPEETGETIVWSALETRAKEAHSGIKLLSAGDVITGFEDLQQIDALTDLCLRVVSGFYHWRGFDPNDFGLDPRGHHTHRGWRDGHRHADEVMKPKTFFGKLINMEVLMFDDIDISFREMNPPPKVISYGFFADMHSSGLGVRGRVAKLVRAGSSRSTSSYYTLQPTLNYANLPTNTAEKAAKELQAKSIATSQEVVIAGLKRMYPAGLPGHGKRR